MSCNKVMIMMMMMIINDVENEEDDDDDGEDTGFMTAFKDTNILKINDSVNI